MSTRSGLDAPHLHRKRSPSASPTNDSLQSETVVTSGGRSSKTPRTEKAYKGLRHFSMMVCKKVEEKGTTTYNEVADELVQAVVQENQPFDEKNIRRRVYDALNVLMAMDIITKEKKEITWRGLPTGAAQDVQTLQRELEHRREQLHRKRESLGEMLVQQVCYRALVQRNRAREAAEARDRDQGRKPSAPPERDNEIPLPFIVVNTNSSAVIQCNMSRDLTDVMFDFSMPFEINDDNTIMKRLGLHNTTMEALREWLPDDLLHYCQTNSLLGEVLGETSSTGSPSLPTAEVRGFAAGTEDRPQYHATASRKTRS